ncbi:hypothetical protein [uncultured Kordia sp.]|uniref:hypothetical protein n=1 Tax=uncultured Kordia sp. TaxID=507699 RepID=UPI00262191DB|nr:hypothetical protein [uncultured Kordia sp.]
MKYLFVLFSVALFTKGCGDKETQEETVKSAQDDISIQYEAVSRGFYERIQVSKEQLALTKVQGGKVSALQEMAESDWNEIVSLLSKIDAEKIKTLEAPSAKRLYDGAAHAVLTIQYKDVEVSSNSFDHGNPPKELTALVDKMQAMAKAVDKQ